MVVHVAQYHPTECTEFTETAIAGKIPPGRHRTDLPKGTSATPLPQSSPNKSGAPAPGVLPVFNAHPRPGEDGYTGCKHDQRPTVWHEDSDCRDSYCEAMWYCDGKGLISGLKRCQKCNIGICHRCWRKAYPEHSSRTGGTSDKRKYGNEGEGSKRYEMQKRWEGFPAPHCRNVSGW